MVTTTFKNVKHNKGNRYIGVQVRNGVTCIVHGDCARQAARRLNYLCRMKGFPIPNPTVGYEKLYSNISKRKDEFVGQKTYRGEKITVVAKTERMAAKKLNSKCVQRGIKMPNPELGIVKAVKRVPSKTKRTENDHESQKKKYKQEKDEEISKSRCVIC